MMRLQMMEVQEGTEEIARGKTKTTSKVSKEDDSLTGSCLGHYLVTRDAPLDPGRHFAGPDEGIDGDGRSLGAVPARARSLGEIWSGSLGSLGSLGEIWSGSLHWSSKQEDEEKGRA